MPAVLHETIDRAAPRAFQLASVLSPFGDDRHFAPNLCVAARFCRHASYLQTWAGSRPSPHACQILGTHSPDESPLPTIECARGCRSCSESCQCTCDDCGLTHEVELRADQIKASAASIRRPLVGFNVRWAAGMTLYELGLPTRRRERRDQHAARGSETRSSAHRSP